MKINYLEEINKLEKNFFVNYPTIKKLTEEQLKSVGEEFFILNNCYEILGKFESTLPTYCQICYNLTKEGKFDDDFGLLLSYLHLNDMKNVRRMKNFLKEHDDNYYFIIKDYDDYQDSGQILNGKYVSITYDYRVEDYAKYVFEDIEYVENFMSKEWDGIIPPKIRIKFLFCDGPGPYNANMNEAFFPVKSMNRVEGQKSFYCSGIIHETFHLINSNIINNKSSFQINDKTYAFKFLDEGYANMIEFKFAKSIEEERKKSNQYAKKIITENHFNLNDLLTKWDELWEEKVNGEDLSPYALALSFAFFLEEKFGNKKYKKLFIDVPNYSADSWVNYVEEYFHQSLDSLMREWEQTIQKQRMFLDKSFEQI